MVIPAFVEMEDGLPDAILNYFEQSLLVYGYEMEEGGNVRNKSILPRKICSTSFNEIKLNGTEDMKTTI